MRAISSIQPRKQRKALIDAPLHRRHRELAAHLGEALLVKYNRRSLPLVKGDTVKVVRGAFRGHEDKIASIDHTSLTVIVEGVTVTKADGTKKPRPVDPSNLVITRLNLTDPLRRERLLGGAKIDEATKAKLKAELEKESQAQKAEIEAFKRTIEERKEAERKKRREEMGETEAQVDPVTQKPIVAPKEETKHEHPGGEALDEAREKAEGAPQSKPKKEEP